jgi:AraC-like DNA-binding protein
MIENSWGSGEMQLESLAPSKANDKVFMEWLANYFRSGASPSAAMVLTKMNTQVDIIDILGSIHVPTLIMQRTNDIDVKIEEGRFIAERIEGAKFVEFEGNDHLFWVGNSAVVLEEMKAFITNVKPETTYEERLFTILAARIISSDIGLQHPQELIGQFVARYRGKVILNSKYTLVATFEGPSKAVHCGMELVEALKSMQAELAISIHIREGLVDEAHFVSGETKDFIEAMLKQAEPGQILITQAVKALLSGAGLHFVPHKPILTSRFGGSISLFMVTDRLDAHLKTDAFDLRQLPKNDTFLGIVLQSIDDHLGNEAFGVEMLCRDIGMSERQLQRKLKAITNKSPIQLISSVRLHRAKELLLASDSTVAEIAFETGFTSPSYFSKCFKKEFGISPSEVLQKEV